MTNKKINTDEMVETVARMNEQQRRQFVRTMVSKWSETAIQIANQIDQEVYDKKHYGWQTLLNELWLIMNKILNRNLNKVTNGIAKAWIARELEMKKRVWEVTKKS